VNTAHAHVEQMVELHKIFEQMHGPILNNPTPVYEFLLEHGQEFQGIPWTKFRGTGYRKMKAQMCFANCWAASLIIPDLTYYEGYAHAGLITVHHAWCVDEQGRVVDFTWRKKAQNRLPENEWEYFGVGFNSAMLNDWMRLKPTASVLYDLDYTADPAEFVEPVRAAGRA
jgi:hypothetical protein